MSCGRLVGHRQMTEQSDVISLLGEDIMENSVSLSSYWNHFLCLTWIRSPPTRIAIHPSRLFRCELQSFGGYEQKS